MSFEKDEYVTKMKEIEISYVVYALELMKLWVENVPIKDRKHIHLGVNNAILKRGGRRFICNYNAQRKTE